MGSTGGMFGSQNQIKAQPKNLIDFIQLYGDVSIRNIILLNDNIIFIF